MSEKPYNKKFKNAARCKLCKQTIESKHRHDFVSCSCGEIFVDGGQDYWRGGAKDFDNFERLEIPIENKAKEAYDAL